MENAETKLKLAELVGALADDKLELAEVQNLLLDKDKKIMTLEETLHTRKNVVRESLWYWCVDGGRKIDRVASSVMTRSSSLLGFKITEMVIGGI